jgi:DtxR family Mn-dependent transcriptional regulator
VPPDLPAEEPAGLSAVAQDYLKVIWNAQEWSLDKVSTKMLAEKLGVSASTASESIRKLAEQGLVDHEKYGAVTLTESGRRAALAMVRRHRLLEAFLVKELGYSWDEVHDEAEVLEHAVSDRLVARIDAKLGFPQRDPHGDPIPGPDGQVPTPPARQLWSCADGEAAPGTHPPRIRRHDLRRGGIRRRTHHGRPGESCSPSDLDGGGLAAASTTLTYR